uniref:CDC42 effector protein (Rho GTPase binding) 4a n=1 Tax=Labrus bergylta TaxID=56723 RepID=A0A3Q3GBG2_9LABR
MPILKQLVSGSAQTKRRSRMDLTREMISAPLGDFRHTMHVGRSGDAFGDTSFLSSRSGEPPPESTSYPSSPGPASCLAPSGASVMSFHLDLGPSMLGDILGVMEKEDDDLGYEEGKSSEGRASPALSPTIQSLHPVCQNNISILLFWMFFFFF